MVKEDVGSVHDSIAILIVELQHPADWFHLSSSIGVGHVPPHLDYPKIAMGIEGNLDRITNQWFTGHEIDPVSRLEFKSLFRFRGREWGRWWEAPLFWEVPLNFAGTITVLGSGG